MKNLEIKAANIIKDFVESELGEYSHFKYELEDTSFGDDNQVYVEYEIKTDSHSPRTKTISFKVTFNDSTIEEPEETDVTIEVDLYEGNWQETKTYNFQVKYFWMALLTWDI